MDIKKKLSKPYLMREKIAYTQTQIEECEMYIDRISPIINNTGIKNKTNQDLKTNSIINLIAYKEKLICEINTLYKHKIDVSNIIDNLENELDKLILKKHYLNYEPWTKISEDLSLTYQTIHAHHKKSLEILEKIFTYNSKKI
ncbi:hypothetical protein [Anaerofustis sp.]|uniref:hypothetical protein n=1 Tax=Anaerofustis sp. TaxID=1872517 RepID=UPI0025C2EDEC|nr:hypothetical protein [Anaerofustis sp.]